MAPNVNGFNCLAHGDAWLPNFQFKFDENNNELIDCQFIDFQQSVFTSPAVDLINLIFTSAQIETKLQNFEYFVNIYHQYLVENLKLLGYKQRIPTLKELYLDTLDRGFLGVWVSFANLPPCLVVIGEESTSDNLIGGDEAGLNYKRLLYNNDRYRKHMTELLNYFNQRGLVDLC